MGPFGIFLDDGGSLSGVGDFPLGQAASGAHPRQSARASDDAHAARSGTPGFKAKF
jgi:hypothetical protein